MDAAGSASWNGAHLPGRQRGSGASACKLPPIERVGSTGSLAIGLAAGAVVLLIIFAATNVEGAVWLLVGALGLAAAVVAFGMSGGRPRGATLGAGVVGVLLALLTIVWGIVD